MAIDNDDDVDLRQEIANMANILHELQAEIDHMDVSQSNKCSSRTRDANPTDTPAHTLCWYHETWGDQAHRCRPPCARSGEA